MIASRQIEIPSQEVMFESVEGEPVHFRKLLGDPKF